MVDNGAEDLGASLQNALEKAAAFKKLFDSTQDETARDEYGARVRFYLDLANELRRLIAAPED